jgi:putative SOS response-associated peptidase YedK
MCGRFTLRTRLNRVLQEMGIDEAPDWEPRFNIAPTQPVPVVRAAADAGRRTCDLLRWGLVPSWAEHPKAIRGGGWINARGETVATQPAFRSAFRKRRCLLLADGYYEWKATGAKTKQPFFIHRPDNGVFAYAGLWEAWRGEDGAPLETCALITTAANELTRSIHDRMPVILDEADWDQWLAAEADPARLQSLLQPLPSDRLVAEPVSTLVNNPRNDRPECVAVGLPEAKQH